MKLTKVKLTKVGELYPLSVAEGIVELANAQNSVLGCVGHPGGVSWDLLCSIATHKATNLRIVDEWVICDIQTLDTPHGKFLENIIENNSSDEWSFAIWGSENVDANKPIKYNFHGTIDFMMGGDVQCWA